MSSIPPLQCLFCNHLNPADASFCNRCGSPMHLQPCDRCGAIDKRSAKSCYKCGSGFTLPAPPDSAPDAAPAVPDDQPAAPSLIEVAVAREQPPLPEDFSPADFALQTVDEPPAYDSARSARAWGVPVSALLLVAAAAWGYYYFELLAPSATQQGAVRPAPQVSGALMSDDAATPTVAPPLEGASVATGTTPTLAPVSSAPDETPAPVAPTAGAAITAQPSAATADEVKTLQAPPILKECPPAVATLGLCSPISNQEKP